MNLELLDAFAANRLPEVIEAQVKEGHGLVACYNRRGSLLAVGCQDGRVVLWDCDTQGVVRICLAHVCAVSAVDWSKNGRLLLTASLDYQVIVWNVVSGAPLHTVRFEAPVLSASFHPSGRLFVASLLLDCPVLVDITTGSRTALHPDNFRLPATCQDDHQSLSSSPSLSSSSPSLSSSSSSPSLSSSASSSSVSSVKSLPVVAGLTRKGDQIYVGTAKGTIYVLDTSSLEQLCVFSLKQGGAKSFSFNRTGRMLVAVNCTDKCIRLYRDLEHVRSRPPELVREFRDYVSSDTTWNSCGLSADGEWLAAGCSSGGHRIRIWNHEGHVSSLLEGPKEAVVSLAWHPLRQIIVSCTTSGQVFVWAAKTHESWTAFAPGFRELEENEAYIEREDEFDADSDDGGDAASKRRRAQHYNGPDASADELIDVTTVGRTSLASSDSDDELWFLPPVAIPDRQAVRTTFQLQI